MFLGLFTAQVTSKKREYESAKEAVSVAEEELARQKKEIKQLAGQRQKAQRQATEASLEARKQQHKLDQCLKDAKDSERRLSDLVKKHPWMATEKAFFGVPGGGYDFASQDVEQSQERLKELKANQVSVIIELLPSSTALKFYWYASVE